MRWEQYQHQAQQYWPWTKECLNPLCAKFFKKGQKHIFTFYVIPPHLHVTGSWNPSSSKTRIYQFYIVNIMGADVLATQGARASATMILTLLNQVNSVPGHKGLKTCMSSCIFRFWHWIKIISFNIWARYFEGNFKGTLWNSTQNISPIQWEMCILLRVQNSILFLYKWYEKSVKW